MKKAIIRGMGKCGGQRFLLNSYILYLKGKWLLKKDLVDQEQDLFNTVSPYIQAGSIVLDIGAHVGFWSRRMLDLVGPSGQVHAFEPTPDTYSIMSRLWGKHPNFARHNCALSNSNQMVEMIASPDSLWSSAAAIADTASQISETNRSKFSSTSVETHRLDDFSADLDLSGVSLIKCDVEGHELEVVEGGAQLLTRHRPVIVMEILREKWPSGDPVQADVAQRLISMNYGMHQVNGGRMVGPDEFMEKNENFVFLP